MKKKKAGYPILEDGFVKNCPEKVKNVGKPSIFIGSSGEAIPLAEKIQSRFEKDLFQVDIWSDGIFGKTKSSGGDISNMEWLKNFSDIYDFAIFLFTLEDDLKGIRKDQPKGKNRRARVVRHNVVFEFGMFLGRIGVKRSFILVDSKAEKFVDQFFTDLKENKKDKVLNINAEDDFQIEFYDYGSIPKKDYGMKDTVAFYEKYKGMEAKVDEIKKQITKVFKQVDIGFLPATSLAIGYFNNSVNIFLDIFSKLKANEDIAKREEKNLEREYTLRKKRKNY
jgi:predicted nucleotide-binding protein